GKLRVLKGIDVLLEALALLRQKGRTVTAVLIGDGPDRDVFTAAIDRLRLGPAVTLLPPMTARKALTLGRVMVVPSRAESFPYVVLEAAAAGKPLVATRVGGIPEILGPQSDLLVRAGDAGALADSVGAALNDIPAAASRAETLQRRVGSLFTVNAMVDGALAAYREALERRSH
ncbi:MAG TPA: glycosyltransferase, partial [Pseudolabrys sp.]|nr:glycosyltransferase [Pseudolabrys sp.]